MSWKKYSVLSNAETTEKALSLFLNEWNNSKSYITQTTSGSTGKPKLIHIEKSQMLASAKATNSFFNLNKDTVALLCISPAYIGGKMMIVRAIEANYKLILANVSTNCLQFLDRNIDFCAMVPLQVEAQIEYPNFDLLKTLIIGGASINEALKKQLSIKNTKSFSTFGMTETISHIALQPLTGKNEPFIAIGATNFETEDGNLVINAPHLGIDKLKTTDSVILQNKTQFYWKGRTDFVINSGGIKIHPEEIESKLKPHFSDRNIIIFGKKDTQFGEAVQLLVEAKPFEITVDLKNILNNYQIPKAILFVDKFEYTASGKVNRIKTIQNLSIEG